MGIHAFMAEKPNLRQLYGFMRHSYGLEWAPRSYGLKAKFPPLYGSRRHSNGLEWIHSTYGKIINISSFLWLYATPGMGAYALRVVGATHMALNSCLSLMGEKPNFLPLYALGTFPMAWNECLGLMAEKPKFLYFYGSTRHSYGPEWTPLPYG
ncbi:hypothetical protein ACFE04_024630 [Oxalis oulophora]